MKGRRVGFTLVELLVVITIISMLMALLMPAVQQAREAGRRATCMNNQKQIMTAMVNYESAKGRYPGWRQIVGYDPNNNPVVGSWVVEIMPYIEMDPAHRTWKSPALDEDGNYQARQQPYIPLLNCPSSPTNTNKPSLVHTVNCGLGRLDITDQDEAIAQTRANGVFFDHLYEQGAEPEQNSPDGYGGHLSWATVKDSWSMMEMGNNYLTTADGTSNTVVLVENDNAGYYAYDVDGKSNSTSKKESVMLEELQQQVGVNWDCNDSADYDDDTWGVCDEDQEIKPTRPNFCTTKSKEDISFKLASPHSGHPGIFMASFADGRTQIVNEGIALRVYQHIMTPDSEKANGRKPYNNGERQTAPDCASRKAENMYDPSQLR